MDRPDAAPALRRFSLLLERMAALPAGAQVSGELASQLVATAASNARSSSELDQYLQRLRAMGGDMQPRRLFTLLADNLPAWQIPLSDEAEQPDNPLKAMRSLVQLAPDPREGSRRFREVVEAAIEQFNKGSLARAVTMFDLADRLTSEIALEAHEVRLVRGNTHDLLSGEQLRKYTEQKEKHAQLRRALSFFTSLTPDALLDELEIEQKRDRRRMLLALLEVHGQAGRGAAFRRLEQVVAGEKTHGTKYYLRNLLYLLSRVPRADDTPLEREIELVAALAANTQPSLVVKEALADLAQLRHERAERALLQRLSDYDSMIARPQSSKYEPSELKQLLDRAVAALARQGSEAALSAIASHAIADSESGDARARIATLANVDLSPYPTLTEKIVAAVRNELPRKVLGFTMNRNGAGTIRLVEALGSTPTAAVRQLFEELRDKFGDQDLGRAAVSALGASASKSAPQPQASTPSLTGDIEVFGLPNLLQSLADSRVSGVLSITDAEGRTQSNVTLDAGRFVNAQTGRLSGKDALFQLFEEARPGNFAFVSRGVTAGETVELSPLIFEAMRRHDELRRARLLAPEGTILALTGAKPQPHAHEGDPKLMREVWLKATSGAHPSKWEQDIGTDAYRVWRLVGHWIESGALAARNG